MNTRTDPKPGQTGDHEHPGHHADHPDCPEHMERCYINLTGIMDCPKCHAPPKMKTKMLTVACGADDPKAQIASFIALPGNLLATVAQVIDLGHNGWLVIFNVPE